MPMTWDAAADAKLFTVVMAVYDIKISGSQNERIAQMMGAAITHRLSKIRAQASSNSVHPSSPTTPSTPKSREAHAAKFSGTTPWKSAKAKGKGKDVAGPSATHTRTTIMRDDGGDDEEEFVTPTTTTTTHKGKKRKVELKAEEEEDGNEVEDLDDDAIDFEVLHKVQAKGKGRVEGKRFVDLTEHSEDDNVMFEDVKVKMEEVELDGFNVDYAEV